MANILIVSCAKIRDISCVACLKCFKAAQLKEGEFAKYDSVQIVGNSSCGDCPGLVMPKVGLVMEMSDYLDRDIDAIHIGTCVVKAKSTAGCPIDLDGIKAKLEAKYGKPVVLGTHNY
ncbi:CGGC domain-containing protein [Desulfosporosinus sp. SYSU MS00001]|uniref:CGGC domain-containing protein n=1 Tax=Desulfosporosinus sp. SYSU MS00001 TaxID=3416284 RepID=UPI003CF10742